MLSFTSMRQCPSAIPHDFVVVSCRGIRCICQWYVTMPCEDNPCRPGADYGCIDAGRMFVRPGGQRLHLRACTHADSTRMNDLSSGHHKFPPRLDAAGLSDVVISVNVGVDFGRLLGCHSRSCVGSSVGSGPGHAVSFCSLPVFIIAHRVSLWCACQIDDIPEVAMESLSATRGRPWP